MNFGAYGDAGASQFGGGGFMPSPAPGHDNQYGAGGGGQQKGRSQNNSLRAFTIRHLLKETANVEDDRYKADGHDITTVTIVGKVTSYREQSTRVLLQLHDGTASMEVCSWVDDADMQAQKPIEWQVGRYVRVYGNLKTFEGKRSITAFAVKPVTDHNEVTYHFLQCVMQHLHLTKGAPPTGQPLAPGKAAPYGSTPAATAPYGAPGGGYGGAAPAAAAPAGGDIHSDLKAVYNLPHATAAPNGLSVEAAHAELQRMGRAHYNLQQVMQACEYLAAEGVLYSTVNDTTFKSTGA
ncbi:hypothetical protein HYH02_000525 [Chlamydomonas schloesseri]|uniref:Replication protein A C-terminal domain-containing protein n=1 Tax=Chlamydomonas schloesseri TaxID=2026947 RepID=A0A836BCP5_9CHLO|nr:hypothetical protein HYH02_000525 [Chlamydomonas schloesseri]|eukprot:KAG2454687.1 hypothetical protein HYH02_000525 [Chlamydomonas schloesseri]